MFPFKVKWTVYLQQIAETYKDGTPIHGLVDYGFGPETHADAVNAYIQETLSGWVNDPEFAGSVSIQFNSSISLTFHFRLYYRAFCRIQMRQKIDRSVTSILGSFHICMKEKSWSEFTVSSSLAK